ncbi:MAG: acyl-CoA dehydrogenase [Burkholderiales bacterium]|nr:acyl-CoA dehydrogenase [Burkholderiales bacterium]
MDAAAMGFDASRWVGRTTRTRIRAVRETVEMLEASLDRAELGPAAPMPLLRHWLWLFAPPTAPSAVLSADGHLPRGELAPDWPLPRRMWAASDVAFLEPVPLDTVMERVSTIESATLKSGRSGTLGFVVLRHHWLLPDGRCAIDDAQTVVYREAVDAVAAPAAASPAAPAASAAAPVPTPVPGAWNVEHRPDAVRLFRYSALSFNSHRIHYDLPYASGVEGYPGLVVHGPLMGTLMLDAFQDAHPGARVRRYGFRALSPAFADAPITCGGVPTGDGRAKLWVRGADGREHVAGDVVFY